MSIKFRVNDETPLTAYKVGSGGEWSFVRVKGSNGDRKTITIWIDNGVKLKEGEQFRVTSIRAIRYASRQVKGEWRDEFSLNASIEKVGGIPDDIKKATVKERSGTAPEYVPPSENKEPKFYDIMTGTAEGDEGLPF